MPMILPTQRTLSWSLFSSLQQTMARGGRRWGGVKCERVEAMFNQELTPIGPRPNLILFDPLHCYKKFIHAVGDHHWPRQNIWLVRTLRLWPMLMSTAWQSHSMPKNPVSQADVEKRGGGGWGEGVKKPLLCQGVGLWDLCWLGFCKKIERT